MYETPNRKMIDGDDLCPVTYMHIKTSLTIIYFTSITQKINGTYYQIQVFYIHVYEYDKTC